MKFTFAAAKSKTSSLKKTESKAKGLGSGDDKTNGSKRRREF